MTCVVHDIMRTIQWNPSNLDYLGPEESNLIYFSIPEIIISGVEKYTNMVLEEEESVLIREVSLFQGLKSTQT